MTAVPQACVDGANSLGTSPTVDVVIAIVLISVVALASIAAIIVTSVQRVTHRGQSES